MTKIFNCDLLRVAREARKMSQKDLADLIGVSQGKISKIENRLLDNPSSKFVDLISKALNFPSSFFFEKDRIYGVPVSVQADPKYRKKSSVKPLDLENLEAELNIRLMHLRRLLKSAEFDVELSLPHLDPDEHGSAENVAELIRRVWLIPSGPLSDLSDYIERAGCIIIPCDFSDLHVDGVTINAPGTPPCIFINKTQPADRQRFTLAHELGHIVMHRIPSNEMEDEANEFASALLMPKRDISQYLVEPLTIQRLASLKPVWKVSIQSLLMRAKTIGVISENQSQYLWRQISKMGYRKSEPPELNFSAEQPAVLSELIRMHLEDLSYQVSDLCKILHVYEDDLRRMHFLPSATKVSGSFLRVIK